MFWHIYLLTQIICQNCPGGDDEDSGREDEVPEEPGIQQPDEEKPSFADGTVFHGKIRKGCNLMKTISNRNNSKTDLALA